MVDSQRSQTTAERLEEAARALLGLPFAEVGREEAGGLDCLGLLNRVYWRAFGLEVSDYSLTSGAWRKVAEIEVVAGDVAMIQSYGSPLVDHVAIVMPDGTLLEAVVGRGVIRSPLRRWKARIRGYARHRDLDAPR